MRIVHLMRSGLHTKRSTDSFVRETEIPERAFIEKNLLQPYRVSTVDSQNWIGKKSGKWIGDQERSCYKNRLKRLEANDSRLIWTK